MRLRSVFWIVVSLACFIGAYYFYRLGEAQQARKPQPPAPAGATNSSSLPLARPVEEQFLSAAPVLPKKGTNQPALADSRAIVQLKYRLSNTPRTAEQLARDDRAILLANALIDLRNPLDLNIPESLRAGEDPGAYLVQSRGPINDVFRNQVLASGASIVSYFPNNAFLVAADRGAALRLRGSPAVQAVLRYEPYYKLDARLLDCLLGQPRRPLPDRLNVVVFAEALPQTRQSLEEMGVGIVAESKSPFGVTLTLENAKDVAAVAGLPGVGNVEGAKPRRAATDLIRARVGIASSSIAEDNYLGLNGTNIIVSVNDTGVNGNHEDLQGRVFGPASASDENGHGTHVGGIIAGDGKSSTSVSNVSGSVIPPVEKQFRGMAAGARLFSQDIFSDLTDLDLQEAAARTNAIISNNSWTYEDTAYDIASSSFDAAVRDSLPGATGSQPVTYVFAAGNEGGGDDIGLGGSSQSILSPATAKNVITVGAIEQLRNITNLVARRGVTNATWLGETDSANQVAAFSSRGNVGIGVEGDFGRFKPDVVAPGSFVVAARSPDWNEAAYYNPTSYLHSARFGEVVEPDDLAHDSLYVPPNAVELIIRVFNTQPHVENVPIYVHMNSSATTADPFGFDEVRLPGVAPLVNDADWYWAVGNPTNVPVTFDMEAIIVRTNELGDYFQVLSNMNNQISDKYRYESGTSIAAPVVSGTLALIADFFTNKLQSLPPSPAMMKAMLINGARPVNPIYDFDVKKDQGDNRNYQGWGLVNLTNSVPIGLKTNTEALAQLRGEAGSPMIAIDQDPTNALATADQRTFNITLSTNALEQTLRVTLVWTDPPGNPAAGIKLVNDLDLVVTNLDTKVVYFGNNFLPQDSFSTEWDTNSAPQLDSVNNVENIYITAPQGTNYSITVIGRSVNVNAVTAHTNKVAQDFALVVSVGGGTIPDAIKLTAAPPPPPSSFAFTNVTYMTNQFSGIDSNISGGLLLNQHVGANSPITGERTRPLSGNTVWGPLATNGMLYLGTTNQWHFYVLTNTQAFSNAAFVTFLPPTLAIPRMGVTNYGDNFNDFEESSRVEGDIDMYVTQDLGLLELQQTAIDNAEKSLSRFGTEVVALTNAQPGAYYIGIHAPDRQAAEYAFFGAFSLLPFSEDDGTGVTVRGINVPMPIPDGTPDDLGVARILAICVQPIDVRRVIVTNLNITHEDIGDLVGTLTHNREFAVLHNHRPAIPEDQFTFSYVFEDNGENHPANAGPTDGPGSLRNFVGARGEGLWLLTEIDDALGATGRVNDVRIRLDRAFNADGEVDLTIQPNSFAFTYFDVPPEATNFTISVSGNTLPLELYVRRDLFPTRDDYDHFMRLPPGSTNTLAIGVGSVPPLQPGRYFIGIYNPNDVAQTVHVVMKVELDVRGVATIDLTEFGPQPILDDAVTFSTNRVPFDRRIARVEVGVTLEHPRVSDLALTLLAPNGKRILLSENRGGTTANMGSIVATNITSGITNVTSDPPGSDSRALSTGGLTSGVLVIDFDFETIPDSLDVFYDGTNIFSQTFSGSGTLTIPFGPGSGSDLLIELNRNGNENTNSSWSYTANVIAQTGSYFVFSENNIVLSTNRPKTILPMKFAVPPFVETGSLPPVPAGVPVVTGPVLNPTNGHSYYLTENGTWTQSEAWAVALGGHLATVRNASEDAWIFNTFSSFGGENRNLWIGLRDLAGDTSSDAAQHMTNFSWVSGETVSYRNWYPGEPNNGGGGADEYFALIDFFYGGRWQDGVDAPLLVGKPEAQYGVTEVIVNTNTSYYFPEESLDDLRGDNALGDWKLEIWDNRVGPDPGTNSSGPLLLSWQLRFVFDRPLPDAQPLSHDVPVTNSIPPCGMKVYSVDVPTWARFATNTLISSSELVNVYFTTNDIPTTNNTPAFVGVDSARAVLSITNGSVALPQINPGGRYYIGIYNPCDNATNAIVSLKVEFDITALQNGVAVTSTNVNSKVPRYFFFDVSTNATAAMFQLTNMTGNFDLVARRGGPLPTIGNNHYGSFNPGTQNEQILVLTNSAPVPLTPGRWYLGVFNQSLASNVFTIVATEFTNGFGNIVTLTNSVPYTNSAEAGVEQYYRYTVSGGAARVQFEVNNPSGDVTLFARRGLPLPAAGDFDYESANPYLNDEVIVVTSNSMPVTLSPGDWYLTVANVSGAAVNYRVMATEWTTTGQPIAITNIVYTPPSGTNAGEFCITWNSLPGVHYHIQAVAELGSTNWVAVTPTITATSNITTRCVPITSGNRFFRVVEGNAVNLVAPAPTLSASSTAGGIALRWSGGADTRFQVEWTVSLAPAIWTAFTPNPFTSTNAVAPHSFSNGVYQFVDDGTQPPPPAPPQKFYRILQLQ